ncbi:MAG TPA: Na/Pi cotransporter family protein [Candidatus Anaerotruncus excrementipullorum]|uniref:Na/Pi cotransporter family protein n=1 Tax=Candidatus Anaerotruncus excrementipullorum TaxID=2838465 RepID=A0A9D1WR01_9FIRM|nr:Na/Pi cotransporter family protein [Candidatus Anaerotruncus excrementipullorum]
MQITDFLSLLGGLALFLYGMQMMGSGLEAAAGNKMKRILERLTTNRFMGVAVGAGITAVIQSSSATTVMVVGFVNSGLMTLQQAVWVIMGANIGTTITAQLIVLDIGALAPLIAFCGVAIVMFIKTAIWRHYGQIIAGLGILFIGMNTMSTSMEPLKDSEAFVNLMVRFQNPLLGILAGMIFTAIIQSSSASVGILQALATSGLITLPSAVYVLFGQNIGTCITAVLAAIGTSRNAKRTTIIHLMFNIIGTCVFTILCMTTPLTEFMMSFTPNPSAQIANMHTLFNVTTTILLLPLGVQLAKLAMRILPDRPEEHQDEQQLLYIKPIDTAVEYHVGTSAIIVNGITKELGRMLEMARSNIDRSFQAVLDGTTQALPKVEQTEDYIDYLNKEISKYITSVMVYEGNKQDSAFVSALFKVSGNLERIGDHAMNICEYTKRMEEKEIRFSPAACQEIEAMRKICLEAMDLVKDLDGMTVDRLSEISALEQKVDDMTELYRNNQMQRLQEGTCMDEGCILYSEMLTDFERIGDHILNVGQELATAKMHNHPAN